MLVSVGLPISTNSMESLGRTTLSVPRLLVCKTWCLLCPRRILPSRILAYVDRAGLGNVRHAPTAFSSSWILYTSSGSNPRVTLSRCCHQVRSTVQTRPLIELKPRGTREKLRDTFALRHGWMWIVQIFKRKKCVLVLSY